MPTSDPHVIVLMSISTYGYKHIFIIKLVPCSVMSTIKHKEGTGTSLFQFRKYSRFLFLDSGEFISPSLVLIPVSGFG